MTDLFDFLETPGSESMNFLNEVALRYPDAVSFAAGRPSEEFFSIEAVHRYVDVYVEHLRRQAGQDEAVVCRTLLQYGRTKGIIDDLVAQSLLIDEGIDVDAESIVITVGAQEAMWLILRALRRTADDVVLTVSPGYAGLNGAAALADVKVLAVRGAPNGLDLADLGRTLRRARASGHRPRALYLNTDFANPTGLSLDRPTRTALLRIAEREGILLIEDSPYGIFGNERDSLPSLKALDRTNQVVYVGSFAKSGFPGARVGFIVADQTVTKPDGRSGLLADEVAKIKSLLTVNTSPISQALIGGKLLEHGLSMRAANKREITLYQRNLRHLLRELDTAFPADRSTGISWNRPEGGFFLLLDLPFAVGDGDLERSAREHGVLWTPMHLFHGDGRPRRSIRLSFSHLTPSEITEGVRRLAAFVRS